MDPFFSTRQDGEHTVVEFKTEALMNPLELERIGAALFRLIDDEHRRRLVLDFTPVKYLSSQAIGMIVSLNKKLSGDKAASLVLCGVGPQLMQLLKITRLDRVFKVVRTQADATATK